MVKAATMVDWHQVSSLANVTDMWHTLKDWTMDLRNRFVLYIALLIVVSLREQAKALRGLDHDEAC